jgi:hypothetical protein
VQLVLSRKVKLVADRSIKDCTEAKYDLIVLPVRFCLAMKALIALIVDIFASAFLLRDVP